MIPTKRRSTKSLPPPPKKKKKKEAEGEKTESLALDDDIDQLIDASASVMQDSIDGSLPTDYLSLIVKCLILRLKNEDVLRRELILQKEEALKNIDQGIPEENDNESISDKEGKKGKEKDKKAQVKDDNQKPKSKKSSGTSGERSSPKKEKDEKGRKSKSKGKKESERDIIEDQPLDGPQMYITLTGFYDAHLPVELTQIGVPINSIVKISGKRILADESNGTDSEHETLPGDSEPSPDISTKLADKSIKSTKTPDSLQKSNKSSASSIKKTGKTSFSNMPDDAEIHNFWFIMKNNLNARDTPLLTNNIAFLTLPPQEVGDLDGKKVYDQVCNVLFDTHDLTWLHNRYLSVMAIREIPNERLKIGTEVLDELMKSLPPGRMTVGFFLNAMLAQVCHTETMCEIHSKGRSRNRNKRRKIYKRKEKTLLTRSLHSIVDEECNAFFKTFHPDLNLPEATVNMLKHSPVPTLLELYTPVDEIANKIHMFRLREHSDPDLVTPDSIRNFLEMLRINTMKCKNIPTYRRNKGCSRFNSVVVNDLFGMTTYYRQLHRYKLCHTANKRDRSLTYQEALIAQYLNADLVAFMNLLDSLIKESNLSKNRYFYEDKSVGVNLQCLNEAYNTFNCMDYVYIDVLDTILLQFHNRYDERGIFNDYWMETLTTPVGLRDFCSFILTENRGWVRYEQEKLKEQREKKLQELERIRNEQFHSSEVTQDSETFHEDMNVPRKDRYSEEVCRRDESVSSSLRIPPQEVPEDKLIFSAECEDLEEKLLEGYNLGSLRIQIHGRTTTFYSTKSSQVRVETRKWLYGGDELLGIEIVKSGHTLILNKTLDSTETQSPVSFHVISASNIVLTLKERNMLPPPSPVLSPSTDQMFETPFETVEEHIPVQETTNTSKRGRRVVIKVEGEPEVPDIIVPDNECDETPPKNISYDVKLSWPTGLLLETVPCSTGEYPIYVRQRYASSVTPEAVSDEKYRCVLNNGTVLVFKKNGNIIIMSPNGTIFTCKKYRKQEPIRPPSPPPPPPPSPEQSDQLETTSDDKISKEAKGESKKGTNSIDKEEETPAKKGKKGNKPIKEEEETPGKKDKKGKKNINKEEETQAKKGKKGKESNEKGVETPGKKDKKGKKPIKEENKEEEIQGETMESPPPDDEEEPPSEKRRSVKWSSSADIQGGEPLSEPPDLPHLPASSDAEDELPEFCPLNVIEYDVLTPMGEYYTVKDGAILKVHKYVPLNIDTDENTGEVYILRTDGTKTFFKQNGNLMVTFPDGTRISTRMIFDEEENVQQNIKTEGKNEETLEKEANEEGEDDENEINEEGKNDENKANEEEEEDDDDEIKANEEREDDESESNEERKDDESESNEERKDDESESNEERKDDESESNEERKVDENEVNKGEDDEGEDDENESNKGEDDENESNKGEDDENESNKGEDDENKSNKGEDEENESNKREDDENEANEEENVQEEGEQENELMDSERSTQEIHSDYSESEESIIKSFVSVHLGSLVEHPNYANVSFDNKSDITKILMPMNVALCIYHSEGEICIKLDKYTCLEQRQRTLKFSRGPVNETYINLDADSLGNDSPLCETTGEIGDRFIVYSSGETSYIPGEDKGQSRKVPSRRNEKRYFALSRDLSGREYFPRYVYGEYLFTILQGGGRNEIKAPITDPLIYLHKVTKPIWDTPTQKWTAKYVEQPEHPEHLDLSNLSNLHHNPYVWLQYRNRPFLHYSCENVQPPPDQEERQVVDVPWRVSGRIFYDITQEFAETIMEALKKYCDEGVASVDLFMSYEMWLEPWQLKIVDEALKTGKVPVMKVFAHFKNHVDGSVIKSLEEIAHKYIVLEDREQQKKKK